MKLPEKCPAIPLIDRKRIMELALILERQTKLPYVNLVGYLEHAYMLGYLEMCSEAAQELRQQFDVAIRIMGSK